MKSLHDLEVMRWKKMQHQQYCQVFFGFLYKCTKLAIIISHE